MSPIPPPTLENTGKNIRVLVTADSEVARAFTNNFGIKKADQVYAELSTSASIFIDPFKADSYRNFVNLEYSLGFSDGAGDADNNFQITLKMYDFTGFLEDQIVNNMIDVGFLQENIKLFLSDLNKKTPPDILPTRTNIGNLPDIRAIGQNPYSNTSVYSGNRNLEKTFNNNDIENISPDYVSEAKQAFFKDDFVSKYNAITRHFYFIFINNNNDFLAPIVSQLYSTEVSQNSNTVGMAGNRELTLKFICAGHPNLLSKLAFVKNYNSESLLYNQNKKLKSTEYIIERTIDLKELDSDPVKLDYLIKTIIKELFQYITGREIILVLPDFGKIYENYKGSESNSLLDVPLNYVSNSVGFTALTYYYAQSTRLKSFLNALGFNIFDTGGKDGLSEFVTNLDANDKKKLKSFKKNIEDIIKDIKDPANKNKNPLKLFKLIQLDTDHSLQPITPSIVNITRKEGELGSYVTRVSSGGTGGAGFYTENVVGVELTKIEEDFNKSQNRQQAEERIIQLLQSVYLARLYSVAERYDRKDLKSVILPSAPSNQQAQQSTQPTFNTNLNVYRVKLTFKLSSDEQPQSGGFKLLNQIDFNEFANNFSNKLNLVSQDSNFNNFNISFVEENNLARLKILKETLILNKIPQISTDLNPCIVVFDKWMYDNYYNPITGSLRDSPDGYPISKEDLDINYSRKSKYIQQLILLKNKNRFIKRGLTIPFDNAINVFLDNPTLITQDAKKFTTDIAIATIAQISPQLFYDQNVLYRTQNEATDINTDKFLKSIHLFIFNANQARTEIELDPITRKPIPTTRPNVVQFNLTADTLNAYASMNAFLKYYQDAIVDDEFLQTNVDYIRYTLGGKNVDFLIKEINKYLGDPVKLQEMQKNFKKYFEEYFEIGKTDAQTYMNGNLASDLIQFFGTDQDLRSLDEYKLTPNNDPLKNQRASDLYNRVSEIREKSVLRCFEILTSYSLQTNKNGVVKVRSEYLQSPEARSAELYNLIYNRIYTLNLDTFAMFQINSVADMNSPAAVLIYRYLANSGAFNVNGYDPNKTKLRNLLSPISGMYRIIGFKHVITRLLDAQTGSTGYSKFILIKDVNVGSTG